MALRLRLFLFILFSQRENEATREQKKHTLVTFLYRVFLGLQRKHVVCQEEPICSLHIQSESMTDLMPPGNLVTKLKIETKMNSVG